MERGRTALRSEVTLELRRLVDGIHYTLATMLIVFNNHPDKPGSTYVVAARALMLHLEDLRGVCHDLGLTSGNKILCEVRADEDRESRYAKAYEVARIICGECRDRAPGGRGTGKMVPNATNSMIHDGLQEIERVAGC